jgi:hypothetical protein
MQGVKMTPSKLVWTAGDIFDRFTGMVNWNDKKKRLEQNRSYDMSKKFLDADEVERIIKSKGKYLRDDQSWIIAEILLEFQSDEYNNIKQDLKRLK